MIVIIMIEILGTMMTDNEAIATVIGAIIGALLTGYALYVVAKVRHDSDVQEAVNDARIAGEEYPSWKIEKAGKWYKGYKLALVELIALSVLAGVAMAMYAKHTGYANGIIEVAAVALAAAVVLGYVLDVKIVHPMADNKFMEDVEKPLVDKFLQDDVVDPDLVEKARKLKEQGII